MEIRLVHLHFSVCVFSVMISRSFYKLCEESVVAKFANLRPPPNMTAANKYSIRKDLSKNVYNNVLSSLMADHRTGVSR